LDSKTHTHTHTHTCGAPRSWPSLGGDRDPVEFHAKDVLDKGFVCPRVLWGGRDVGRNMRFEFLRVPLWGGGDVGRR